MASTTKDKATFELILLLATHDEVIPEELIGNPFSRSPSKWCREAFHSSMNRNLFDLLPPISEAEQKCLAAWLHADCLAGLKGKAIFDQDRVLESLAKVSKIAAPLCKNARTDGVKRLHSTLWSSYPEAH